MNLQRWLIAACVLLATCASAQAVTIFERGKTEPTRGRLVRETALHVTIDEVLPDGRTRERVIPRTVIEDMIDPVSAERLKSLSPDNPQAYRNYAEELAEKRIDPDARAAAIRLYLIAAHLAPEDLARSCLLGMTALARTPAEERKFRAMAYLYDPDHDRRLLREAAASEAPAAPSEARDGLVRALQLRRQGNRRAAILNVERTAVKEELSKHADVLTYEEFAQPGLPDELLSKIVGLELALESGEAASAGSSRWSQLIVADQTAPIPSLTLETLTEFDPRRTLYRNGKWVAP
ncbi:MAG: hypothetical protein KY475_00840 [Planctomycetes bacterium]|nr:hypothetical protein [Planctomycetota bacterium]